jgi:ABC-type nitrate/sulfonate/bicarbonate transport system permease component
MCTRCSEVKEPVGQFSRCGYSVMRFLIGLALGLILGLYLAVSMPHTAESLLARIGINAHH